MKPGKTILTVSLCFTMCLSLIPAKVLADEGITEVPVEPALTETEELREEILIDDEAMADEGEDHAYELTEQEATGTASTDEGENPEKNTGEQTDIASATTEPETEPTPTDDTHVTDELEVELTEVVATDEDMPQVSLEQVPAEDTEKEIYEESDATEITEENEHLGSVSSEAKLSEVQRQETSEEMITSEGVFCFVPDDLSAESEDLLTEYAAQELGKAKTQTQQSGEMLKAPARPTSGLNAAQTEVYYTLKECIEETAAGERQTAQYTVSFDDAFVAENLTWTPKQLGYSELSTSNLRAAADQAYSTGLALQPIHTALLNTLPYELYWYDKTMGVISTFSYGAAKLGDTITKVTIRSVTYFFSVADEYFDGKTYAVNGSGVKLTNGNGIPYQIGVKDVGASIQRAINNARNVVSRYSSVSDVSKLAGYKDYICSSVSYNNSAIYNGTAYGNPWQLIWVFDGDSSTNVVCEGYAKAFEYLCDLSSFSNSNVRCYTVTGTMAGGLGAGEHMWNIVMMDDGRNYLVDTTNCDAGSAGSPDRLFLKGCISGDTQSGYVFNSNGPRISYLYDSETLGYYSRDELTLSPTDYGSGSSGTQETGSDLSYAEEMLKASTPELISISSVSRGVRVQWEAVSYAERYYVCRKLPGAKYWTRISSTTDTAYIDKNVESGQVYSYTIRAERGSILSKYNTTGLSIKFLAAPKLKTLESTTKGVRISWSTVTGAENYMVFRRTGTSGSFHSIGTTKATSYTDQSVQSGITYNYTVRCVGSDGTTRVSGFNGTGLTIKYIGAPVLTSVESISKGVKLSWEAVTEAENYMVFRRTGTSGNFRGIGITKGTSYTDQSVDSGTIYNYTVRCVGSDGTTRVSGFNGAGMTIQFISAPRLLSAKDGPNGVVIRWDSVTGAENYMVFRRTGTSGSFRSIGTTKKTAYTDQTAQPGITYNYTVRCIASDGATRISGFNGTGLTVKAG